MTDSVVWEEDAGVMRVNKVVGEAHLRKYGHFLESYDEKLNIVAKKFTGDGSRIFGNDPIIIKYSGIDTENITNLVQTENKVLNKVITVLAALCGEVRERVKESAEYYTSLLIFAEELDAGGSKAIVAVSNFLSKLQDLANFVDRCQLVVCEFIQQLAAIYAASPNNQIINASNVHFEDMMQHLGELLVVLVTIDGLINNMGNLAETWELYKRLLPTVQVPGDADGIKNLSAVLVDLQSSVLSGQTFLGVLSRLATQWSRQGTPASGRPGGTTVAEELQLYVRNMLGALEGKGSVHDPSALYIRTSCVLVLTVSLFGIHDKKLMRQTWEGARRFPCVPLAGPCVWHPDEFFLHHLEHLMKSDDRKYATGLPSVRSDLLTQRSKSAAADLSRFSQETSIWTVNLDVVFCNETTQPNIDNLKSRVVVFLGGLKIANEIKRTLRLIMNLHAGQEKPMTRGTVLYLCALTELLSAIELAYERYNTALAESCHHATEFVAFSALNILTAATERLSADKTCTKKNLDALSALLLAQSMLSGPATPQRLLVTRLALSVARGGQNRVLKDEEVDSLYSKLKILDQFSQLQTYIRQACDASHLYFHRVLLPIYLDHAEPTKVSYLLNGLPDVAGSLTQDIRQERLQTFETAVGEQLGLRTLRKTREGVETSLRLQVHAHLQKERNGPLKDQSVAVRLQSIRLFDKVLSFKSQVESYLDATFYNLTTVALHDWRSYGEMRALARFQLGLELVHDSLPCQTLEQGLDVLEVIRNIQVFVAAYQYNMNNQLFVERESPNKHLNTIGIRHVSNSIRTHGTGIVNTTVNFIYQYLRNKFFIFSQFLFDEQIKSRLAKDVQSWKDLHARGEENYPYERADRFVKGIRKLGVVDGLTYLDQFRILITHIGNAMGYIRLVRSGGMHACSNSLNFLPEASTEFEPRCGGLSPGTITAASRLDHVVRGLTANFADGSNYFKLLVDVFAVDFRNSKHGHLNNFYIIVPPLTISFIDHMLAGKEKVARRKGGIWTDDGFAIGLAYVLTLLNQHEKLASLHWFNAAKAHHSRDPSHQSATSTLTAKRLDAYSQEFDLLAFGLNSAKIFFQKETRSDL